MTNSIANPKEAASLPLCGRKNMFGGQRCMRPAGHYGLHFDAKNVRKANARWGDNEAED